MTCNCNQTLNHTLPMRNAQHYFFFTSTNSVKKMHANKQCTKTVYHLKLLGWSFRQWYARSESRFFLQIVQLIDEIRNVTVAL